MPFRVPRPVWAALLVLFVLRVGWMTVRAGQSGFQGPDAETLAGLGAGVAVAAFAVLLWRRLRAS